MALFAPSSWAQRTTTNLLGGGPRFAVRSLYGDEVQVPSVIQFTGGNPNWAVNDGTISFDKLLTWNRYDTNPSWPEVISNFHTIQLPSGKTRFVRSRYRFGRSFFIANNEIPAGYITIDISDTGTSWSEVQKLYEWPHKPDTGSGGQAQHAIESTFLFLPGTGPAGADADWMLIKASVSSGQGTSLNVFDWWRSDDFGLTWIKVRAEAGLVSYPNFIVRGGQGGGYRLVTADSAGLKWSSDNGVTWNGTTGIMPSPQTHAFEQAGQTWCILHPGTGTGGASIGISCDNFASVVGGESSLSGLNVNWAGVRLSPTEILATISAGVGNGQRIYYSTNGGEHFADQGNDTRMNASQAGNVHAGLFFDGAPYVIGADGKTFISGDRSTGISSGRVTCPLANAALKKAGIPPNCGHPMLVKCD